MEGLYFASGVDQNFVKDINKMMASMDALKNKTVKGTAQMEDSFSKLQKRALQIFSGVAITSFIKQTIEVRNEIENLTNAFTVMLKSREKANQLMKDIVTTAATTPFSVLDLAGASKQLLAFGQDSETMIGTLRRLGDVASASGSNIGEVTAVYGKVMGKGKLELEQLNSLTERGIPVLQELAKMHDTNTQSILKMISEGKIGFADLQQSIFNLTAEGGKFYNMMQTQSATVSGLMSNLGDQYDQMLNEIGQSQTSTITTTIKLLSTLLDHWEAIASAIGVAVVAYGSYKAVVMTMSAFNEAKMIMSTVQSLGLLTASLGSATVAQTGLNIAMTANPIGLVVAGVTALIAALYLLGDWSSDQEKALKALDEQAKQTNKNIAKSFEDLKKKLNKSNLSEPEVLQIQKEMIKMYPKELSYLNDKKMTQSQLFDILEKIEKKQQNISDIELNNDKIKMYEADIKSLQKTIDEPGVSILGIDLLKTGAIAQSNKKSAQEDIDDAKFQIDLLRKSNEEKLKENQNFVTASQKLKEDDENKKIAELQKTNELEYQLKVNQANKMYGADVDNAIKLKDALYRIELDYIDKQLKAIDEQNKGKMTKELELQKAQLDAKKIGLINQRKLELEEKSYNDRKSQIEKNKIDQSKRVTQLSGFGGEIITKDLQDEDLSFGLGVGAYKMNKLEADYTIQTIPQNEEYVKLINEKIVALAQATIEDEYLSENIELEKDKYKKILINNKKGLDDLNELLKMGIVSNKAVDEFKKTSEDTLQKQKDVISNLTDQKITNVKSVEKYTTGEYLIRDIINSDTTVAQNIKNDMQLLDLYNNEIENYRNDINKNIENLTKSRKLVEESLVISDEDKRIKLNDYDININKQYNILNKLSIAQKNNNKKIEKNVRNNIEEAKVTNKYISEFNDEMALIENGFSDLSIKKYKKTQDNLSDKEYSGILDLKIDAYSSKLNEAIGKIKSFENIYKELGVDFTKKPIDVTDDNTGDVYDSSEYIALLEIVKKLSVELEKLKGKKLENALFSPKNVKDLENVNSELFKTIDLLKSVDDTNLNNFIDVINNATTSAFQLADIILKLQVSTSKLQTFGLYMAGIGVVLNFMVMIDEAQKKAEENRDKALANELKYQYEITDQKIKQLALYEQGNEFYSSDKFGATLASLDAYNEALIKQNALLLEIKQNAGVTDYDKGIVNFMRSEKQDRGEAKDEALQQETLNKQALASIEIRTKERSKLGSALGFKDKYSDVLSLYPQVVSVNDEINYGILENIIATEDLSDADKQRLQNLVDNNKLAIESYKALGEYISSIFGNVGEDTTKAFQDSYEKFGNVADAGIEAMKTLEMSFSDMIENMTRDVIENAILQPLINQLNSVNKALGEEYAKSNKTEADTTKFQSGILASLGQFYTQINGSQSIILDTYQKADELAKQAGFDSVFNSGTTSGNADTSGTGNIVGASITQDVSNELLARCNGIYLNTEHMLKIQRDASDYAMKANLYLSNISANSNYLISIDDRLKKMNDKL